ncbi:hypothetical protein J6590_048687 [Homalodisca vitripennis]|nr:hypothetical protein J6590_048687 [Homalodisca vitripennis]
MIKSPGVPDSHTLSPLDDQTFQDDFYMLLFTFIFFAGRSRCAARRRAAGGACASFSTIDFDPLPPLGKIFCVASDEDESVKHNPTQSSRAHVVVDEKGRVLKFASNFYSLGSLEFYNGIAKRR